MSALVGGETASETNKQGIRVDFLHKADHAAGVSLILQPALAELLSNVIYELGLQGHASTPDFCIGHIVDCVPDFLVALVSKVTGIEMLGIKLTPFGSTPGGEVYAIGDVAHMTFFGEVAAPDMLEHFLGNFTVEPADAIDLLRGVAGKCTHAELLSMVLGIGASQTDELIPGNAQQLRIAAHVFAEKTFVEVIVAGRNGCVNGVQRGCTNKFHSLVESETLTDVVHEALDVAQGGVAFVAMVNVLLDAELLQQQHTADTEQDFLLQTVLPVAAVEGVSDGTVELGVHLVVSVEQIKLHTANIYAPY